MPSNPVRHRAAHALLMVPMLLAPASCITAALWQNAQNLKGKKVTASLLTPVTLALDVGLFVGLVYVGGSPSFGTSGCESQPTVYAPGRVVIDRH